jgi:UDP-N-acetylglucosamine 1-carboxyvinyltransferase
MDKLQIQGGVPLEGEVRISGAKNATLPILAGALLAEDPVVVANVPHLRDVTTTVELLGRMGATVTIDERMGIEVDPSTVRECFAPYDLVKTMRASILVLGPLVARYGRADVSLPGGCAIGARPVNIHVAGLQAMGADITIEGGYIRARATRLRGARLVLDTVTVTGTENLMMAATLADGETVIENAAREPEVQDLAAFLCEMGARISGAGTSRIEIEGVDELSPATHVTVADRVEAATFLAAVGLATGDALVRGARPEHMDMVLEKLEAMGVETTPIAEGIRVRSTARLDAVDVATLPYPGVATDYLPLLVTMLSVASGVAIVSENVFAERFRYVDELRRMGADIRTEGHHAVVRGVTALSGAPVRAPDIRAGAALVLAGLVADGETKVSGAEHIDRGYEDFVGKLVGLGADIDREVDPTRTSR